MDARYTRGVHKSDKEIWWMVDYVAENVRYKYGSARMKMWRKRDGGDRWVSVLQMQDTHIAGIAGDSSYQ